MNNVLSPPWHGPLPGLGGRAARPSVRRGLGDHTLTSWLSLFCKQTGAERGVAPPCRGSCTSTSVPVRGAHLISAWLWTVISNEVIKCKRDGEGTVCQPSPLTQVLRHISN